jgi:hypothetical protein
LTAQIIFLSSCKTTAQITNSDVGAVLADIAPPVPVSPEPEPVRFEDRDGGLWLSYNDYRALERNIIAVREYAAKLEIIIGFYREERR